MRGLVFLCLIFTHISVFIPAQETTVFTPLADNEQFAFSAVSVRDSFGRNIWEMTLYAVHDNDFDNLRVLFSRRSVNWSSIQFSNNNTIAFFRETHFMGDGGNSPQVHNLYIANGKTGGITPLLEDMHNNSGWRASKDGRFICFLEPFQDYVQINLFDVAAASLAGQIIWRPDRPDDFRTLAGSFSILRTDNAFRILWSSEITMIAEAIFDPSTMDIRTLWNGIGAPVGSNLPEVNDPQFRDDVLEQFTNRVQR